MLQNIEILLTFWRRQRVVKHLWL